MSNNRRIIQHTDNHYDIEEFRTDSDGNQVWAVIYCSEDEMQPVYSTPAVLVTGADSKGNEYCHQFAHGEYMDLYNEVYITPERFRALYPIVQKVYFGETEMTGDQWRDIQCPLSMTIEQIECWRENVQYVDVWVDPRTPEEKAADTFAKEYSNDETIRDIRAGFQQW